MTEEGFGLIQWAPEPVFLSMMRDGFPGGLMNVWLLEVRMGMGSLKKTLLTLPACLDLLKSQNAEPDVGPLSQSQLSARETFGSTIWYASSLLSIFGGSLFFLRK